MRQKTSGKAALALVVASSLLLTACSGTTGKTREKPAPSGGVSTEIDFSSDPKMPDWERKILEAAPVADPAEIPADSTLLRAHERDHLINAASKTFSNFSVENPLDGRIEGFEATLARMLSIYLTGSSEVETITATADTRQSLIDNGTTDLVLYAFSITPERQAAMEFAGPYYASQQAVGTMADTEGISQLTDLIGKDVCTSGGGSAYLTVSERIPGAKQLVLESPRECMLAVEQGRAVAMVSDDTSILGAVQEGKMKIAVAGITLEPWGIALPKGSTESVEFINDWLDQIIKAGLWEQLWQETIGKIPGTKMAIPTPGENLNAELNLDDFVG